MPRMILLKVCKGQVNFEQTTQAEQSDQNISQLFSGSGSIHLDHLFHLSTNCRSAQSNTRAAAYARSFQRPGCMEIVGCAAAHAYQLGT